MNKAFNRKYDLSDELYQIVKKDKATRGEVMKKVWAYIKRHDLQDEYDRRVIVPDEVLGNVIGHRPINMFKMAAKLDEHLF